MERKNKYNGRKLNLVYNNDIEGGISTESVWVVKEGDYYRIKNIPFFAPNLAYDDLVKVEDDEGELFFDSLIEPSGHSTIQIIFFDLQYFKQITDELVKLKCSWEGSHLKEYISVDIPKKVNYAIVKDYLDRMSKEKKIDYKEACLAHEY